MCVLIEKRCKITKCETDDSLKYKHTVYYKKLIGINKEEKKAIFYGSSFSSSEQIGLDDNNSIIYGGILAIEPDDRYLKTGLSSGGSKRKRNRKRKSIKKKQRKSRTRK
jgi:hypothetical protein